MSILVAEANRRGLTLAPEEASGLTVLLSLVAGYFVAGDPDPQVVAVPPPPPPQVGPQQPLINPFYRPPPPPAPQGSPSNAQPS